MCATRKFFLHCLCGGSDRAGLFPMLNWKLPTAALNALKNNMYTYQLFTKEFEDFRFCFLSKAFWLVKKKIRRTYFISYTANNEAGIGNAPLLPYTYPFPGYFHPLIRGFSYIGTPVAWTSQVLHPLLTFWLYLK